MKQLNFFAQLIKRDVSPQQQADLTARVLAYIIFIPPIIGALGIGMLLSAFSAGDFFLGERNNLLIGMGGMSILGAALYLPSYLFRKGKWVEAASHYQNIISQFAFLILPFFWEYALIPGIVLAWMPVILNVRFLRYRLLSISIAAFATAFHILLAQTINYPRLLPDNPLVGVILFFLASAVVLVLILVAIWQSRQMQRLESSLIVAILMLVSLPALISAISTSANLLNQSSQSMLSQLEVIATLREEELRAYTLRAVDDVVFVVNNPDNTRKMLYVLNLPTTSALYEYSYKVAAEALSNNLIDEVRQRNEEYMLIDLSGTLLISTTPEHEGINLSDQAFLQRGLTGVYVNPIVKIPDLGGYSLIVSVPVYRENGQLAGVLAKRTEISAYGNLVNIAERLRSSQQAIYLVNIHGESLMGTTTGERLNSPAVQALTRDNVLQGASLYTNHSGEAVLGVYHWLSDLRIGIIVEAPQAQTYANIPLDIGRSTGAGILFTIVAGFVAIWLARSISEPIRNLANGARELAGGNLSIRMNLPREDEVGDLARAFNMMAVELQSAIGSLEQKVVDRTRELERQALRLRVSSEVARDAASASSMDELLNRSAELVRDRFGFYHAGIFIIEPSGEYAILRAAPGEAGARMLEAKHRLRVGKTGLVGHVAATGEALIALDTGADAVHFENPFLPRTRSEIALPLKVNRQTIGVLDVQSDEAEAFTEDDIATLQVMADQLAVAIERTRLFQEAENNLREVERAYRQFTERSWRGYKQTNRFVPGYRFDGTRMQMIKTPFAAMPEALQSNQITTLPADEIGLSHVAVPIRLRGQTIGAINVQFKGDSVPEELSTMVATIADRLAVTMETVRLLEDAQTRAERERALSDISTKIGASINLENVLRTAAEEVSRMMGGSDVTIQIQTPSENA
jgi:GAF domain-containing protein/HAMP domain-containing protein